jgi:hypothetical protein
MANAVIIRPWAEFRSDLPTDTIETDDEIIQVGGKTVGEEIGKILVRLGCTVDEPVYEGDHGWGFNARAGDRCFDCQISDVGHFLFLIGDKPYLGWFRKRPNQVYWDILTKLADELDRDARFWDIVWHTPDTVMSDEAGAARPVGDQPPLKIDFD